MASAAPTFDTFVEQGGKFCWLTTSENPCPGPMGGCAARNEVVATLAEWMERGLPRTGATFCGGRCYCILVPMLDIGIGTPEDLDSEGFNLDEIENEQRLPGKPFADMDRLDPQDFLDDLRTAPATGITRTKLDALIHGFEHVDISFDAAREAADRLLGLS